MHTDRYATTRDCTRIGARCWIKGDINFGPPEKPALKPNTPATIVAEADRGDLWVEVVSRFCIQMDRRGLAFSQEYRTRKGRWLPEWHPRARLYLLYKLEETRAWDGSGSSAGSHRSATIASYKFKLRRNGWYAADDPDD